jgi:hypothetical protein
MQKVGLMAALAVTVAVAVYTYPKSDRSVAARVAAFGAERDSSQPAPLDKLKAATRSGVNAQDGLAVLPAPRVMDSVKQEIQARQPGPAGMPVAAKPAPAADSAIGNAGIDKLASKLPAVVEPAVQPGGQKAIPITAVSPASSAASTLVVPRTVGPSGVSIAAPPAAAITPVASARDDVVPSDAKPASPAVKSEKAAKTERRRVTQRDTVSAPRQAPATTQLSRQTSLMRRNEGL